MRHKKLDCQDLENDKFSGGPEGRVSLVATNTRPFGPPLNEGLQFALHRPTLRAISNKAFRIFINGGPLCDDI